MMPLTREMRSDASVAGESCATKPFFLLVAYDLSDLLSPRNAVSLDFGVQAERSRPDGS
jgi:hypothetical protein